MARPYDGALFIDPTPPFTREEYEKEEKQRRVKRKKSKHYEVREKTFIFRRQNVVRGREMLCFHSRDSSWTFLTTYDEKKAK